jgi:hypothetical protein
MLKFSEFIKENGGRNIPIVFISSDVNFDEINEELDECTNESVSNPYVGWLNITNTLLEHGIELPKVLFEDIQETEEVIILNFNESEYYFYYNHMLNEESHYESFAIITDEAGLDELLKE